MNENEEQAHGERLARIEERMKGLAQGVKAINDKLDNYFISRAEFTPIRNLVYGFTGLLLTGIVVALIALVIRP